MQELIEKLETLFAEFSKDAKALALKGNAAAGRRSRKASLQIGELLKEYRKASLGK